uniref:Uncharacterized protein n=1 Tax=Kalanchoe fedtschenkoi TaxID=63787 RepID=A0A7N1A5U1_KALFE
MTEQVGDSTQAELVACFCGKQPYSDDFLASTGLQVEIWFGSIVEPNEIQNDLAVGLR